MFYGLKSSRGKVTKLSSEYSQAYNKTDHAGLRASLKSGTPQAFPIYQQLTRTPTGEVKADGSKIYRYKLTGRHLRAAQRTVIMGDKGYIAPTGKGFTQKSKQESSRGKFKLIPVTVHLKQKPKFTEPIRLTGETIKDTVKDLKPAMTLRKLGDLGLSRLHFHGYVLLSRPKNPHAKNSDAWAGFEAWAAKIWISATENIKIPFGKTVDRLVNFSDALATNIRDALSGFGVRVTSLVKLQEAEINAEAEDEANRGTKRRKKAHKVMRRPDPESRKTAEDLIPLRHEEEGRNIYKPGSVKNAGVTIVLSVEARE